MPSSRLTPRFTMLAAICALAAISAPTVHSAYLPLDVEDHAGSPASMTASSIPVSAAKANHLASAIRPGPIPSSHREPEQGTHREHHATTHAQSALHPAVTGARESERATHSEHHAHTTTHAQSAPHPAVTGAPTSSHVPLPVPLLLALPQHLLAEQPTTGRRAEDSGGEGSSVTPRKLGDTLVLDLLNPLLLFEEIGDALSRADSQSQGLAQRAPSKHVQAAFDAPHIRRDSTQSPFISSAEHGNGEEGVVSGMRKREDNGEGEDGSGVPGTIDIMSVTSNSTGLQHIGSLVLARADMSATPADQTFFLNASSTHQTQIYLLPIHPAGPNSTSSDDNDGHNHNVVVALQLPMFDPASAAMVRYCATFHPRAAQPEPLAVERCLPEYQSRAAGTSQAFAYDSPTGVVRPLWFDGDDGEPYHQDADYVDTDADAASDALGEATGAGMFARNIGFDSEGGSVNSTAAAAAPPASHAANSTAPMSGARDVTLVFTPVAPEASTQTDVIAAAAAAASDDKDDDESLALALDSTSDTSASSTMSYSSSTSSQLAIAQPSPAVNEAVWTMTAASSTSSGTDSSSLSSGSSMATEANLVDSRPTSMGDVYSDSTATATATATLPSGSAASYTASTDVSPANAEASSSPATSAGSGNSLGPVQSSSTAPPPAAVSNAGDVNADIAAAGPSSSSLSVSSASTSNAFSSTEAASSSTPIPVNVAAAAQTAAPISSSTPVEGEGAGATPSPKNASATTSVSESPMFTNINAESPVSSLASSSAATSTPSSVSASTASTAAPAASPSYISAEDIASLIADTAFSTLAAPPAASSTATEAAMAVEDYSPPSVALAEAGTGSAAAGAPTPLVEEVGVVPEEWVFAPEARL